MLFTSDGKGECEIDRRIVLVTAVLWALRRTVEVKQELNHQTRLTVYLSIYVPLLTYGHELWVMSERSQVQEAGMRLLCMLDTLSMTVQSPELWGDPEIELLLLQIKRHQQRSSWHVIRMPLGQIQRELSQARPIGQKIPDILEGLYSGHAWEYPGTGQNKLDSMAKERGIWSDLLGMWPP